MIGVLIATPSLAKRWVLGWGCLACYVRATISQRPAARWWKVVTYHPSLAGRSKGRRDLTS